MVRRRIQERFTYTNFKVAIITINDLLFGTKNRCESSKSPSEPVFCPHPDPIHESDGALMSLVSPLKDQDLNPFVVVLNGHTLEEISRFYLPDFVHIPVGFHSNWLPRESRYKKKHSYYPHL